MKSPRSRSKPAFVEPMAARLIDKLPEDPEWLYELKFDGYRALLLKDGADVRILSRNRKDLTGTYPAVVAAAGKLAARQAVIDGEIVAHDAEGRPSFQALQHSTAPRTFDVLHLNGADLKQLPLATSSRNLSRSKSRIAPSVICRPASRDGAAELQPRTCVRYGGSSRGSSRRSSLSNGPQTATRAMRCF